MDVPNFHLPLGSPRGWLLAMGEGSQKSTATYSSAFKQCGVWMHYLKADVGNAAHNGTPSGRSQLFDLDEFSCSHLTAGLRCTRVWCNALKDVCSAFNVEAMWSAVVGEATGG